MSLPRVACLLVASSCFAHPGGLDSKGGHYDRKTGTYHYHRPRSAAPPPASSSAASSSLATEPEAPSPPSGGPLTPPPASSPPARSPFALHVEAPPPLRSAEQWDKAWGDFTPDYIDHRVLVVSLRRQGTGDPAVKVEWFFLGREGERLFVYEAGASAGDIAPAGVRLLPATSLLVPSRFARADALPAGPVHVGWVVLVTQRDASLAETASDPALIAWLREHRSSTAMSRSSRPAPFVPVAP